MGKKQYWVTLLLAIAGGFAGATMQKMLVARPAVASEAPQAARMTVQGISLVDSAGKQRAVLSVESDGLARLSFFSPDGRRRLAMGVLADGEPAVGLYDIHGSARIGLSVPPDDSAAIQFYDRKGRARAFLSELADGSASFGLYSEGGKVLWAVPSKDSNRAVQE